MVAVAADAAEVAAWKGDDGASPSSLPLLGLPLHEPALLPLLFAPPSTAQPEPLPLWRRRNDTAGTLGTAKTRARRQGEQMDTQQQSTMVREAAVRISSQAVPL